MIISSSNIMDEATITIAPASTTQDINVVTDGDYSSVYSDALSSSTTITIDFAFSRPVGYLAIGGSNITQKDRVVINVTDTTGRNQLFGFGGDELRDTNGLYLTLSASLIDDTTLNMTESNVLMYKLDAIDLGKVEIIVYGTGTLSIAEIAMGDYYEVPNSGEQGGYSRPWTVPNIQGRTATNLQNSPIAMTYESRALKCKLSVPDNLMTDFDAWYNMATFAATNTFYILEDDNKFHSYACFNADVGMTKAHGKTRSLGASTLTFNAYAKSTQAILT